MAWLLSNHCLFDPCSTFSHICKKAFVHKFVPTNELDCWIQWSTLTKQLVWKTLFCQSSVWLDTSTSHSIVWYQTLNPTMTSSLVMTSCVVSTSIRLQQDVWSNGWTLSSRTGKSKQNQHALVAFARRALDPVFVVRRSIGWHSRSRDLSPSPALHEAARRPPGHSGCAELSYSSPSTLFSMPVLCQSEHCSGCLD